MLASVQCNRSAHPRDLRRRGASAPPRNRRVSERPVTWGVTGTVGVAATVHPLSAPRTGATPTGCSSARAQAVDSRRSGGAESPREGDDVRRALGLFVLGLCLLAATGARAIDLSGTYVADLGFIGSCRFTFTQSGTSLDVAGPCTGPFGSATFTGSGTVDPLTGVFSVAGAASAFCTTFTLAGTGDGEEWTADGTCVSTSVQDIFGTKCTNGVVDPTEECEDGNLTDGDCCSARCTFEPSGSACSADANVCTADVCDGAGACVHPPLSAGTACTGDGNLCTDDACDRSEEH